jgi:catechol 2,3-dioxygenase-like lactoylglutathione lyase family enzyme
MQLRIEHANLAVRDVDGMIRFLQTAFPDFGIRCDGIGFTGRRQVHVGTDTCYLALVEAPEEGAERWVPYSGKPGLNHLGWEVDNADAVRERLAASGYQESTVPNRHPHRKRVYFHDPEGNDWEFVQYLSDDPAERNDYSLPDF